MEIHDLTNRSVRLGVVAACASLLVSCAGQAGSTTSPLPSVEDPVQATASPSPQGPVVVVDGPIDVTADRHLQVKCLGAGAPTIVLEAGNTTSDLTDWPAFFVTTLAESNTVCLYSRAGGFGSTAVNGLLTRDVIVSDAYTLLGILDEQYGVTGPYLFVGWSFGGTVALAEALERPETTAGMVILDTGFPADFMKVCPTAGRSVEECQAEYDGDEEAKSIEKDIVGRLEPLLNIPVTEVSAMLLPECSLGPGETSVSADASGTILTAPDCEALATLFADKNLSDWRQLGPQVKEARLQADHDGLINEAGPKIIEIIREVLAEAGQ
jgi:pimeloyl-ACP methyl ester carboxylesterase